jgi:iron complex transport system ATP-binding protein
VSVPGARGPLLRGTGLSWEAGGRAILDRVDFELAPGELVGVIGPNGAGKTTLLRLLGGLLSPSAGAVELDGADARGLPPRVRARRLAFMSQEIASSFPFTVREILLMGRHPHLRRFEPESAEDLERSRQMLSYVGLAGLEERSFAELSGGERQLVLFARSLVQDTPVLLLDEPSSNLDIRHQDRIFSMAQELAREGRAVAASVHNLGVAANYCSRLVLLDKGRVAAQGHPRDVLRSELLDRIYGIRTIVTPSLATGSLTVAVVPSRAEGAGPRVHLIGGAGSAVNLTRELYRVGCRVTGGIAHEHDSDEKLWRSLGVACECVGAFARIGDEEVSRAAPLVRSADLTILCAFPVGQGNLGNLRLAAEARRLVIIADPPDSPPRSFFAPEGRDLFENLRVSAAELSYDEVTAALAAGEVPGRRSR